MFLFLIVLFSCSVGCDKKEEKDVEVPDNKKAEKIEEPEKNLESEETIPEIDYGLYTDDKKMVFKDGNKYAIYYYSGTKITGYQDYIDYGTEEAANEALASYKKSKNVDNVTTNGKYLVLEYNKSEYNDLTIYKLRTMYGDLEQLPDK